MIIVVDIHWLYYLKNILNWLEQESSLSRYNIVQVNTYIGIMKYPQICYTILNICSEQYKHLYVEIQITFRYIIILINMVRAIQIYRYKYRCSKYHTIECSE